jgi:DNA-binding transcriptional ArsR family regulator
MNAIYPIASVAELIGEPARAAMLVALLEGKALPAGELAAAAGVSAQSASAHLSKLVDGGLLFVQNEGRHRYYRITSPDVAHAIEALGAISTNYRPTSAPGPRETMPLYVARSCYDHLAGRVAVELTAALESSHVLRASSERDYELGSQGERWFASLGVDTRSERLSRRCFARRCLDWTERKPHLAGALGASLFSRLLALGWMARRPKTRALRITQGGEREFQDRFGIAAHP